MTKRSFEKVKGALDEFLAAEPNQYLDHVSKSIHQILVEHAKQGRLRLGEDKNLVGDGLEIRVLEVFTDAGFTASVGRPGLEDLVVQPPEGAKTKKPLVVEVKSDRKPTVKRKHLRELDDWVFDLSGEEEARKKGLGGGLDPMSFVTDGLITGKQHHPSPHKGVFVFNAPIGIDFNDRPQNVIGADEIAFAEKRGFCLIPFGVFITKVNLVKAGALDSNTLWESIHKCEGALS